MTFLNFSFLSTDGRLFQVEYAMEAVHKGSAAVGVVGSDVIVLGVEKKSTAHLQEARTIRKIVKIDDHLSLAFAGLTADARVLINKARVECQSYRLTVEDAPNAEHIAKFVAKTQQKFTQRGGRRPFGISTLIVGFDADKTPHLYQTDPSGTYSEWKANAIGKESKLVLQFLEKYYPEEEEERVRREMAEKLQADKEKDAGNKEKKEKMEELKREGDPIKLAIRALLEVVESGAKNIEIALIRPGNALEFMDSEEVTKIADAIAAEKEAAEKKKSESSSSSSNV
jgi:20S proteasome subunit alpha 4